MTLPIRLADLPADAPRWSDRNGSVWAEVNGDDLVLVEHNGTPVPFADPTPKATVTRQWGPLTAKGAPAVDQVEASTSAPLQPGDPVRVAFDAVWLGTPSSHEKHEPGALVVRPGTDITGNVLLLDRWRVPAATVTPRGEADDAAVVDVSAAINAVFVGDGPFDPEWANEARAAIAAARPHLLAEQAAENKEQWLAGIEHAIRANRAEESAQRLIDDRNSNRMIADRVCAEMYRVRDALGVGPGGADLGLQVRDALAERDAELTRLRERETAWQAHVTDLVATLSNIEHLAWKGLDKGWDVLEEIYQTMTPRLPDVLADATSAPEASQSEATTPPPAN